MGHTGWGKAIDHLHKMNNSQQGIVLDVQHAPQSTHAHRGIKKNNKTYVQSCTVDMGVGGAGLGAARGPL